MIAAGVFLAALWYALRGLSKQVPFAARIVERLSPRTRALHRWVLSAPATFAYIAIFTASTVIQRSAPPQLINLLTTYQSTNLARLTADPARVLVVSSLWVDERGLGLAGYVAVFATVVAWAERRYGSPRIIVIGYSAHIVGSLLTAVVEQRAIDTHRAPAALAYTSDVGVSYVMVGCCAAAVILLSGWPRVVVSAFLLVAVEIPVLVHHTIWDLGHLLATFIGALAAFLLLLVAPPRREVQWPRELPRPTDLLGRRAPVSASREPGRGVPTPGTTSPEPATFASQAGSSTAPRPSPRS